MRIPVSFINRRISNNEVRFQCLRFNIRYPIFRIIYRVGAGQWRNNSMRCAAFIIFLIQCCTLFSAEASGLVTHINLEKKTFLLGEPIFLIIETANDTSRAVSYDISHGRCNWDRIRVQGAKRRPPNHQVPTCGYGGSGSSCRQEEYALQPGEKHVGRLFINGAFILDSPGTYKVEVRPGTGLYIKNNTLDLSSETVAEFDIKVVRGTEDQLRAVYEKLVQELAVSDYSPTGRANSNTIIEAITTMAPPFLEDVLLQLSKETTATAQAIPALGRVNTERTRKRLIELLNFSGQKTALIGALARTQAPFVMPAVMEYMDNLKIVDLESYYANYYALWNFGLFGESAVPYIKSALKDPQRRKGAIRGLGAMGSRSAVSILIELLEESSGDELNYVRESLAQLTHRAGWRICPSKWRSEPGRECSLA
jgi:hypothetical protein